MTTATTVLEHVLESSAQLTSWSLAVFGATVLAVVSTSYRRPLTIKWRIPYLIFIPGWLCVAYSLLCGNEIAGHYLASIMVDKSNLGSISLQINNLFDDQRTFLLYGLALFAIWLTSYMLTWVFSDHAYEGKA